MINFTIVTCTYQAEEVLKRTLDSVLAQSYPNVEHLVIDGASSDRTLDIVAEYVQKNADEESLHEIKVTSEKDGGLYFAMNKGIEAATGDYIVFLNAGDTFPSTDTLEHIAGCVGEGETLPGVLYGDTDIVNAEGHFLRHRRLSPPKKLSWRSFKWGMLVCHQSFYARTDLAKQTLYNTDYRFSADVDWCIRVMKLADRQCLSLKNVYGIITNYLDGGMTNKNHQASLKERFQVMKTHYGLLVTLFVHACFVVRSMMKK